MAQQVRKPKAEIATIDCSLITVQTESGELALTPMAMDTQNQISVEPQIEEIEPVKLIVKGILRAQKRGMSVITGHQITLNDNLFNPELVLILQGGEIIYDSTDPEKIIGYNPPAAGSTEKGTVFTLCAYTANNDVAGLTPKYEKISYPNCQGVPLAFGSEDGVFRAAEYTINSAPKQGEFPYQIEYVDALPEFVDA